MDKIDDGGPVFPHSRSAGGFSITEGGMTLRDYFIAHAPAEPQDWFNPVFNEPEPDISPPTQTEKPMPKFKWWEFWARHVCAEQRFYDEFGFPVPTIAWREWAKRKKTDRLLKWPAAWADAMLKEREVKS